MPPPTWVTGQVLTASDVNTWFVPIVATKTADTSRASTVTVTADPELTVTIPSAGTWYLLCYLNYEGAAVGTGDLKIQVTSVGTLRYHAIYQGAGGAANVGSTFQGGGTPSGFATQGLGTLCGGTLHGTLVTATSGTTTLNWAQNTSNATATTLHANSSMMLWRIS